MSGHSVFATYDFYIMKNLILLALVAPLAAFAQTSKTWRLAIISDMNGSYGSKSYNRAVDAAIVDIRARRVDAVLSTGDMVAGQKAGLDYRGMWRAFHAHVTDPLGVSQIPLLPSPGNHDASAGSSFRRERDEYQRTWSAYAVTRFNSARDPSTQVQFLPGVAQNYPYYYAMTLGPALLISLDATTPGHLATVQYEWLKSVLASSGPYSVKIIFGHMPLYPYAFQRVQDALSQGTSTNGFYRDFENLLEAHQVDLFLSGHHHVFYPGHRNGHVRYVSVPLLGSGARYLLNKEGRKTERSPQAFLYLEFNAQGEIEMSALRSPALTPIPLSALPETISVPTRSSSDCKNCSSYPSSFFLNSSQRTLYQRW